MSEGAEAAKAIIVSLSVNAQLLFKYNKIGKIKLFIK